jgi:hypothetical protein
MRPRWIEWALDVQKRESLVRNESCAAITRRIPGAGRLRICHRGEWSVPVTAAITSLSVCTQCDATLHKRLSAVAASGYPLRSVCDVSVGGLWVV